MVICIGPLLIEKNQVSEIFGVELRTHYGNPTYDFPTREIVPIMVYRIVRLSHDFLDDHNHLCEVKEPNHGEWGSLIIHYSNSKAWFTQLSRLRETRDRQRDTVRGRNKHNRCKHEIATIEERIGQKKSQWPQYSGLKRNNWQQSLHNRGMK